MVDHAAPPSTTPPGDQSPMLSRPSAFAAILALLFAACLLTACHGGDVKDTAPDPNADLSTDTPMGPPQTTLEYSAADMPAATADAQQQCQWLGKTAKLDHTAQKRGTQVAVFVCQ